MQEFRIVGFDPGLSTGVAEASFSDDTPFTLRDVTAVRYDEFVDYGRDIWEGVEFDHVVAERFDLRTNNSFAADLTGVKVEGMLDLIFGDKVVYRSRTDKNQVPDQLLKDHGLWQTGVDVDWSDGRDVNDAIIHVLGYVAFDLRHRPTLEKYFRG